MITTVFVLLATVMFGINLMSNITLLAMTRHEKFPIGNLIGVFSSIALMIFGIIVLTSS